MAPIIAGQHEEAHHITVHVDGIDVTELCTWVDPETGEGECYRPRGGFPYALYVTPDFAVVPRFRIADALVLPKPDAPAHLVARLSPEGS
ncbi:MAG TPA: hypothetical protein VLT87_11045 [Thermoanaerobaculia bacterium]|nr:hypothetical protein [Thermoanaerobaculia bacterium]